MATGAVSSRDTKGLPDLGYVTREWLASALVRHVDNEEGAAIVARRTKVGADYSGLAFPYFWPGKVEPVLERLRLDKPLNGRVRYLSPGGGWGRSRFYLHRATDERWLKDAAVPVTFCEGEKKAIALTRFFQEVGDQHLVVGLSGVWNWLYQGWRSEAADIIGEDGWRESEPLPDFQDFVWRGRAVSIFFDANVHTNAGVRAARKRLGKYLKGLGAVVSYWNLPAGMPGHINGVDDYLTEYGTDGLRNLLAAAGDGDAGGVARTEFELTDFGFLNLMFELYPKNFCYADALGGWAAWTGRHWSFNAGEQELQRAITATSYQANLEYKDDEKVADDAGAKLGKFTANYRNQRGVAGLRNYASRDFRYAKQPEVFDRQPWMLNCKNGTLDLRSAELAPFEPDHLLTRAIDVAWNPEAQCPKWEAFISQILGGDEKLVRYMGQTLGYFLTGDTSYQHFYIWQGVGANGKSVLVKVLETLMGPYCKSATGTTFETTTQKSGAHSDDQAGLVGAHLVVASETNRGAGLDEALIKRISGADRMRVSFKGKSSFEFEPSFKLLFLVNDRPTIRSLDESVWRRLDLVEFPCQFVGPEKAHLIDNKRIFARNENLVAELLEELQGILRWLVQHLLDRQINGVLRPHAVDISVQNYRRDMDTVQNWIDACCLKDDSFEERVGDLYKSFKQYCEEDQELPLAASTFGKRLQAKGYPAKHDGSHRYRQGLQLKVVR